MAENLYCPRCASSFTTGTSFCRSCGLELKGVSEIVKGDASNAPVRVWRPNFNFVRYGVGFMVFGLVLGLIHGILKDFNLYPERYGKAVVLSIVAIAILTMGSAFVFSTTAYKKRKDPDLPEQLESAPSARELSAADTSNLADINFPAAAREPVMAEPGSVTEHTTRHLE
jgi:hypothetical protein